jgi:hypothetical protein
VSKKLEDKRARRLEQERRKAAQRREARRRSLLTTGIAVFVAALVVFLIVSERQGEEAAQDEPIGVGLAQADCSDVETFPDQTQGLESSHIQVGSPHEPYNSSPPTSGVHYAQQAAPGFYPAELPVEQVVHNLEHGQIVIWYAADTSEATVTMIEDYIERENDKTARRTDPRSGEAQLEPLLGVPYNDLQDGTYAMTSWTNLQTCDSFSSAAVDEFRQQFQGLAPEQFAPPFRGGPTALETLAPTEEPSPEATSAEDGASPSPS